MDRRAILSGMRSLRSAVMGIGILRILVATGLAAAGDTDGFYDTLQGRGVAWRAARSRRAFATAKHRKERRGLVTLNGATPSPKARAGQICWHTSAARELLLECSYQRDLICRMGQLQDMVFSKPGDNEIKRRARDAGALQFAERELLLIDFPTAGVN